MYGCATDGSESCGGNCMRLESELGSSLVFPDFCRQGASPLWDAAPVWKEDGSGIPAQPASLGTSEDPLKSWSKSDFLWSRHFCKWFAYITLHTLKTLRGRCGDYSHFAKDCREKGRSCTAAVTETLAAAPGLQPCAPCTPATFHLLQGSRVGFCSTPSLLGSRKESSDSGHPKSRFCFTSYHILDSLLPHLYLAFSLFPCSLTWF